MLGAAGESADPAVHQVLAERETAISNGDDAAAAALTSGSPRSASSSKAGGPGPLPEARAAANLGDK